MTKAPGSKKDSVAITDSGTADRLDLLLTFVRIVEAGSLSSAATVLGTTQPTVSRRLQQLERSLGRRLLHRSTHQMKLSEEGEHCYQRAKELLAGWSSFEADFGGQDKEPEGLLRVLAPHAFGQQLLVGPLVDFLRCHPKVSVEWLLRDNLPDFASDGVDCAILVGEVQVSSTVAIQIGEVPRIVVASPSLLEGRSKVDHPKALTALPWLSLKTYYHKELQLRHRQRENLCRLALQPRFSTDNLYALREAARLGLGVAVISAWMVAEDLAAGRLVHLAKDWAAPSIPVHLVYPYARFQPHKLRRFVEAMRAFLPTALSQPLSGGGDKVRGGGTVFP